MSIQFEAYTAEGIRLGVIASTERLGDLLGTQAELVVEGGRFARLDGVVTAVAGTTRQPIDDFLVVVAPAELNGPAHSVWHDVRIHAGPYVIEGRLPTLPGFDPARALARPTGSFVLLGAVRLGLSGRPDDGVDDHELAWVNRYTVDRIESDLELGFFFPGAASVIIRGFNTDLEPGDAPNPPPESVLPESTPPKSVLPESVPDRPAPEPALEQVQRSAREPLEASLRD